MKHENEKSLKTLKAQHTILVALCIKKKHSINVSYTLRTSERIGIMKFKNIIIMIFYIEWI